MTTETTEAPERSRAARVIQRLALPILLLWIGIAAVSNIAAPQLEVVGAARSVSMNAADAPSIEAAIDRIGPEWHDLSKRAKDMGSAAVLLSLLLCAGIWLAALAQRFLP